MKQLKVLFVCLGNICRSPTAEAVFKKQLKLKGMTDNVFVDSAGTSDWHIGKTPDSRTVSAAQSRGYDMSTLRGRQVTKQDFNEFDYVLAMDESNLADLNELKPVDFSGKLTLFLDFAENYSEHEVPDPYYGSGEGFEFVLDLIEDASLGLLKELGSKGG